MLMDNPQASLRIAQVAGMWLADGHVTCQLRYGTRGKTRSLRPEAGYSSKDVDYIEFIQNVLKENNVGNYIWKKQRHPKRAQVYQLTVSGHKRFRVWHNVVRPYLFGRKAFASDILIAAYDPKGNKYGPGIRKPAEQVNKEQAADTLVKRLNSGEASETIMTEARRMGLWDSPHR